VPNDNHNCRSRTETSSRQLSAMCVCTVQVVEHVLRRRKSHQRAQGPGSVHEFLSVGCAPCAIDYLCTAAITAKWAADSRQTLHGLPRTVEQQLYWDAHISWAQTHGLQGVPHRPQSQLRTQLKALAAAGCCSTRGVATSGVSAKGAAWPATARSNQGVCSGLRPRPAGVYG